MTDYRVNLDVYDGPLDLLLYLIRRDEIDIHNIPIARITAQYCAYVDTLRQIDPDVAGEFLVMATTLMEIKTRMLLPRQEAEDEGEEAFDPRAELVRQLLEYKAFKDAAGDLKAAATAQALRFPRRPGEPEADEPAMDLDEVQIWDLVDAFNQVMTSIGRDAREAQIRPPPQRGQHELRGHLRRAGEPVRDGRAVPGPAGAGPAADDLRGAGPGLRRDSDLPQPQPAGRCRRGGARDLRRPGARRQGGHR
jgi:hypothetical protein